MHPEDRGEHTRGTHGAHTAYTRNAQSLAGLLFPSLILCGQSKTRHQCLTNAELRLATRDFHVERPLWRCVFMPPRDYRRQTQWREAQPDLRLFRLFHDHPHTLRLIPFQPSAPLPLLISSIYSSARAIFTAPCLLVEVPSKRAKFCPSPVFSQSHQRSSRCRKRPLSLE